MRLKVYITEKTQSPFKELAINMKDDLAGLYNKMKAKNWIFTDEEVSKLMEKELHGTRFVVGLKEVVLDNCMF